MASAATASAPATASAVLTTKYKARDGTVRQRVYRTIKGQDYRTYKRARDREYRERRRARGEVVAKPRSAQRPSKAAALTPDVVAEMRRLHAIGLNFSRLGKHFGVSRYVAQSAVLGQVA